MLSENVQTSKMLNSVLLEQDLSFIKELESDLSQIHLENNSQKEKFNILNRLINILNDIVQNNSEYIPNINFKRGRKNKKKYKNYNKDILYKQLLLEESNNVINLVDSNIQKMNLIENNLNEINNSIISLLSSIELGAFEKEYDENMITDLTSNIDVFSKVFEKTNSEIKENNKIINDFFNRNDEMINSILYSNAKNSTLEYNINNYNTYEDNILTNNLESTNNNTTSNIIEELYNNMINSNNSVNIENNTAIDNNSVNIYNNDNNNLTYNSDTDINITNNNNIEKNNIENVNTFNVNKDNNNNDDDNLNSSANVDVDKKTNINTSTNNNIINNNNYNTDEINNNENNDTNVSNKVNRTINSSIDIDLNSNIDTTTINNENINLNEFNKKMESNTNNQNIDFNNNKIENIENNEIKNNNTNNEIKNEESIHDYINSSFNSSTEEIKNNIHSDNLTLIISESDNKVYLPYKISEVQAYLEQFPNKYINFEDVIEKEFITSLNIYTKHPSLARFRETYSLIRDREYKTISESLKTSLELMFRTDINPAIIAACKTEEQLENYIDCLEREKLDNFTDFKIEFKVNPLKI